MTFAVLLPTGPSLRNFGLGGFLPKLSEHGDVKVWHNVQGGELRHLASGAGISLERLSPPTENPAASLLRCAMGYAHLFYGRTIAMRQRLRKRPQGRLPERVKHRIARSIGRIAANSLGVRLLEASHRWTATRAPEVAAFQRLFEQWRPSVVFAADQRPLELLGPILAARQLGIPTAGFIFSWDNLTSKGRMAAAFDYYLVWSAKMRDDLLRLYTGISGSNVHIVGTPQFDSYSDHGLLWSRAEFFERIGGDPDRQLICYSGGDTTSCPEDPQHLEVLLDLVAAGKIPQDTQVLLRPTPVDPGTRFDAVRRRYPGLLYSRPQWLHNGRAGWMHVVPSAEDIQFLANLTYHADVNVNVASTMTLDFAIRNKPVVNVAFDVASTPPYGMPLWHWHYQKEHYRPIVEFGAAKIAKSPAELAMYVNESLRRPCDGAEARRRLVDFELGVPVGESTGRIVEVLTRIANGVRL